MNIRKFLQMYKKSLSISLILHILMLVVFSIEFVQNKSLDIQQVNLKNITNNAIKAVAIDEKKIESIINDIKKEETNKARAMLAANKALKSAKKSKIAEERKLKNLKKEQKILEGKLKKMMVKQSQGLKLFKDQEKEFEQKKKLAKKNLEALNNEAKKIKKENLEKKKLAEEKNKLIEQQALAVVAKYSKKIENKIWKNFAATNEDINKNLSCKVKITLGSLGEVLNAKLMKSSGDQYFDKRAILAVKKSSPLPVPDDKKIFNKMSEFILNYNPKKLVSYQ